MNEPMLKKMQPAAVSAAEFFGRSKSRLNFDVPPGLIDPDIIPRTGDEGNDRMLEIVAREQPVRPAAVLIPVVDHPQPTAESPGSRRFKGMIETGDIVCIQIVADDRLGNAAEVRQGPGLAFDPIG